MKLTDGRGVDLAIDTSGTEICVRQGMEALVKGGHRYWLDTVLQEI